MAQWTRIAVLLGAGAVAGVIGASAYSASASDTTTAPAPSSTSASSGSTGTAPSGRGDHDGDGPRGGGPGGPGGGRGSETVVTGSKAATLRSVALTKVPGGKVVRVETDSGDAAYEVHMTDKNAKDVTVKFDKNLKFIAVESGMGK